MASKRGRRSYTDQEKAVVLAQLEINNGNVKGTARATGIPWETIRTWKSHAERLRHDTTGTEVSALITPNVIELTERAKEGYVGQAELVRDAAMEKLKILIPQASAGNIAALANLIFGLSDRIDRAKGIADRHVTVDHTHSVAPSDEWVEKMAAYVSATREDAIERSAEIIDAEVVEQPEYKGLSAAEGEDE